jgi:predicted transcriptional regulator of viral defense system
LGKYEVLDRLVMKGHGYLQTSIVLENDVSKQTLAKYVKSRGLERAARGVYITEDVWPDDYYLLFLRNGRIVFSFESALYLHGLMDREPSKTTVTVPEGYNASHIVARGVRVIHAKKDWYEIGISVINTAFGNEVPVYDKERTICDIIRNKNYIEIQTFQTAMREYMGGKGKNLGNLISYARYLGIEDEVRTYTEVML